MSQFKLPYNEFVLQPSGVFLLPNDRRTVAGSFGNVFTQVDEDAAPKTVQLCNPFPTRAIDFTASAISDREADELLSADADKRNDLRVVSETQLIEFSQAVLAIGKAIAERKPSRIVSPLRGGLKPALQLLALLPEYNGRVEYIPYCGGSQGFFDDEVVPILRHAIKASETGGVTSLAVVDTAISGDGAAYLGKLMQSAAQAENVPLTKVHFHLMHARNRLPARVSALNALSNSRIKLSYELHGVDSLVVEDWNAALGLERTFDGVKYSIKPTAEDGKVLVRRLKDIVLIDSPELSKWVDREIGGWIDATIRTDPYARLIHPLWSEYRYR
jgi:hypothetical protein